ncbi:hypothetical protein LK542_19275 [Massilia sp. IC2-477]|uniref:hypothetical protein n=1 Tax=Massilia sp. IC2-477 TaxID=2887198 RepID=UPI001D0F6E88|nr:hypothetical protein [Massilia sp. IC2-477]MCC2957765.1 hypothetical protein [Massilia sp. IC2-477]
MPYTQADVAAAIARANGQQLATIKVGGLNGFTASDLGPSRTVQTQGSSPYKKGTGHTFSHVATFGQGALDPKIKASATMASAIKSQWQDRRTAIAAATEMINSPQAQPGIASFLGGGPAPANPVWLKRIPLDDVYYGYEAGSTTPRLVETGSINFWIAGHSLFIYSCYPDGFIAGVKGLLDPTFDMRGLFD